MSSTQRRGSKYFQGEIGLDAAVSVAGSPMSLLALSDIKVLEESVSLLVRESRKRR